MPVLVGQTTVEDKETGNTLAAVNCYFMAQDGGMFKAQVPFAPYFYLQAKVRFAPLSSSYMRCWHPYRSDGQDLLCNCQACH